MLPAAALYLGRALRESGTEPGEVEKKKGAGQKMQKSVSRERKARIRRDWENEARSTGKRCPETFCILILRVTTRQIHTSGLFYSRT